MLPTSGRVSGTGGRRPEPLLLQPNLIVASTVMAEFMGTLLLQLLAGSTNSPARAAAAYAGLSEWHTVHVCVTVSVNARISCGLAHTLCPCYAAGASFARHSGGHLNPALSLAAALSGHLTWFTCFVYVAAQVLHASRPARLPVDTQPCCMRDFSAGPCMMHRVHDASTVHAVTACAK